MRTRLRLQEPRQVIVGSPESSTIDKSVRNEREGNLTRSVLLTTLAKAGSLKFNGTSGGLDAKSGRRLDVGAIGSTADSAPAMRWPSRGICRDCPRYVK